MLQVALIGAGRMAAAVCAAAAGRADLAIAGAVARQTPGHTLPVPVVVRPEDLPGPVDLVIDFSLPAGTVTAARWCAAQRIPLVCGVTGLDAVAEAALDAAARQCAVLWAPNLSRGVNVLAELCRITALALPPAAPVEVEDEHHQWKKDAPSGTALFLGEVIARARAERGSEVRYSSIRAGEAIGRHSVTFDLGTETLVLQHAARDRAVFAIGALDAACWLKRQAPGRYRARDWIAGTAA